MWLSIFQTITNKYPMMSKEKYYSCITWGSLFNKSQYTGYAMEKLIRIKVNVVDRSKF